MIRGSDGDIEGDSFSIWTILFAIIIITIIAVSFIPRMLKGVITGYEWSSEHLSMPFRLPIVRPIYLNRGDNIQFNYYASIKTGQLDIVSYSSPQLVTIIFQTSQANVLTLRGDAEGSVIFKAPSSGFYIFNTRLSNTTISNVPCSNHFEGLWDVLIGNTTTCANYKMHYFIKYKDIE